MKKLNKQEIIHQAEKAFKRTEEYKKSQKDMHNDDIDYRIICILMKKKSSDLGMVKAVACTCDYAFEFSPYKENDITVYPISYMDYHYILEYLENGYKIVDIPFVQHQYFWEEISEYGLEEPIYPNGLQEYMKYCKQNGVTMKKLQEKTYYNGKDIMEFYKKEKHHTEPER